MCKRSVKKECQRNYVNLVLIKTDEDLYIVAIACAGSRPGPDWNATSGGLFYRPMSTIIMLRTGREIYAIHVVSGSLTFNLCYSETNTTAFLSSRNNGHFFTQKSPKVFWALNI
jgi:hypothetical protein